MSERGKGSRSGVTHLDRARVRFEVGDKVSFATTNGGIRTGAIEKLNPARAAVRCNGERWHVPYLLLEHRNAVSRARNERRLVEVSNQARALMDSHGLVDWTFRFSAAQSRLGECREQEKLIRLSLSHAMKAEPREVKDTILHEVAHALAGARAGHGPAWKAIATRIGATPKSRAEESETVRADRLAAKARFRSGMEVRFRTRDGQLRNGFIARMNPKRATVKVDRTVFLVPYPALEPREPSGDGDAPP